MNSRIIALDFDGVICDSMDECMLVAYLAYTGETDLPPAYIEYFRKYRHMVRPAREYFYIVDSFHSGGFPSLDKEGWPHQKNGSVPLMGADGHERSECERDGAKRSSVVCSSSKLAAFEERFFAARAELQAKDFQLWLNLFRLYPQFSAAWPGLKAATTPYIVTTRDHDSVNYLLQHFGIDIPAERRFTKDRGLSKPDAIRQIAAERNTTPANILFVDDHPEHLHDVAETGAEVVWAQWGYWPSQNGFRRISSIQELIHE